MEATYFHRFPEHFLLLLLLFLLLLLLLLLTVVLLQFNLLAARVVSVFFALGYICSFFRNGLSFYTVSFSSTLFLVVHGKLSHPTLKAVFFCLLIRLVLFFFNLRFAKCSFLKSYGEIKSFFWSNFWFRAKFLLYG